MKMQRKVSVKGEWVKKGTDIADGDIVTILTPGEVTQGEFGEQIVFAIKTKNGNRISSFNQTTINNLVESYGDESETWVGKSVKVFMIRQMVGRALQNVMYFAHPDWFMNDEGRFVPAAKVTPVQAQVPIAQIPAVSSDNSGEEIYIEDIKF